MSAADDFARLSGVHTRLQNALFQAGRPNDACRLIVVSKTQSAERLRPFVQSGRIELGENYLAEALPKIEALGRGPTWHFIGAIQSNKTAPIAEHFDWVHTLDRAKIAKRLNDQRPLSMGPLQVLIQVNLDGEASKAGCDPSEVMELAEYVRTQENLNLRGLMNIPAPNQADPEAPHRRLAALLEPLTKTDPNCNCLSMGMTGDMEAAIAAGSTHVRVGTAIFGPRPARDTSKD